MNDLRAVNVVYANADFLTANNFRVHIPGAGRVHAQTSGGYTIPVIYSITLYCGQPADPCPYGVEVYGAHTDTIPIFKAMDTVGVDESGSIHVTFPNGLPCRAAADVGALTPASTAGCAVLGRAKETSTSSTIATDITYNPSLKILFPTVSPNDCAATVTYGYVHQSVLTP